MANTIPVYLKLLCRLGGKQLYREQHQQAVYGLYVQTVCQITVQQRRILL